MIVALDTSTPECRLTIIGDNKSRNAYTWDAGRDLSDGLIGYIRQTLQKNQASWSDVDAFAVYMGPGSFTGLRIGLTVMNTAADSLNKPLVGETGEDWIDRALARLEDGENDKLVMPLYGREPNISTPRK